MTNDEVIRQIHEEFALSGMSKQTEVSYLCALRLFLCYHEERLIETMGESEIREFLLYQISTGKTNGSIFYFEIEIKSKGGIREWTTKV